MPLGLLLQFGYVATETPTRVHSDSHRRAHRRKIKVTGKEREREKGPAHTGSRVASKRQVKEVVVLVFAVLC